MNVLRIALKEIKQDFRDYWTLMFMLAFPLILMLILGFSLTNAFGDIARVSEIRVLVKDSGENRALSDSFAAFSAEVKKSGIGFTEWQEGTDGRLEVARNHYDSYVELKAGEIYVYSSNRNKIKSDIFQGMVMYFGDQYKTIHAIAAGSGPEVASRILSASKGNSDHIKEISMDAERQPGALDYYAVAMSSMVALWGAYSASNMISFERRGGTAMRLVAAPITKVDIFTGKVLGSLLTNCLCVSIVVFVSKYFFNANWGDHMSAALCVLFSEVVLAVSLGLAVSYLVKEGSSRSVIMIITQLAAFFGGSYIPLGVDEDMGVFHWLTDLSPIRWTNVALTKIIYADEISAVWPVLFLNLSLAILMLGASASIMRRKEGL